MRLRQIGIYLALVITLGALGGCQLHLRYPAELPSEERIVENLDYWYWGTEGEPQFEVYNRCPQGRIYEMTVEATWSQALVSVATLGIYTPRTLTVVCSLRGITPTE